MNKIYSRIDWKNYPSTQTPLNEENLNRMDAAVNEIDNRVIEMDTTKLSKQESNNLIVSWTIDESTGVITIVKRSGEQIIFDLNIEKIPVNFSMDKNGVITMETSDGTIYTANISDMIPVLVFNDSDTIAVTVTGTGKDKTYSFSIKNGSVTEDKLQPNYLADIKINSGIAANSAVNAKTSETNAQGYAYNASQIYSDIVQKLSSGEFKGEKGDKGDTGESGITTPISGYFTLYVDENGDLYAVTNDNDTVPLEYDPATGNLYMLVPEEGDLDA